MTWTTQCFYVHATNTTTTTLAGIAQRPYRSNYVRNKVGLTTDEWQLLDRVGAHLFPYLKPGQRPSRSMVVAALIDRADRSMFALR